MPGRLPTILGDRGLPAGGQVFNVDGSDLDPAAAIGNVARGLMGVSEGAGQLSGDLAVIEQKERQIEDSRWVRQSEYEEKNFLNEWMADPKNNTREEYATEFKRLAEERLNKRLESAVSPRAADALQESIQSFIERQYPNALHTTTQTKLDNVRLEVDQQTELMINSFRNGRNVPNNDAAAELNFDTHELFLHIDQIYGEIAPAHAKKLKEHVITQVVLGTMETDPEYARTALARAALDEKLRTTLGNHIDSAARARDRVAQDSFDGTRRDFISAVANGKIHGKIGIEEYQLFYGKDQGIIEKRKDDTIIDIYESANGTLDKISGHNAESQIREASRIAEGVRSYVGEKASDIVAQRVRQNIKLQQENPVAWLKQNNPEVKAALSKFADAPEGPAKMRELIGVFDTIAKYQQNPPISSTEDPKLFLGRASNDFSVLDLDAAEKDAALINTGSPTEVMRRINDTLAKYPQKYHYQVFRDLVKLPKDGIRQEYQFAFQNRDAWWIDSYVAAIASGESVEKLSDVKKATLFETIDKDPTWKQFELSMIGEDAINADQMVGFKNGIAAYSRNIEKTTGKSIKEAVKSATDLLIMSRGGFTEVNGQALYINRERPAGGLRSDEELADLGRRLSLSLSDVDPMLIHQENFPFMGRYTDKYSKSAMQTLRDAITRNGFFQLGDDGQHVTLYYADDNGSFFQVTDEHRQPFLIYFDDLPQFTEERYVQGGWPGLGRMAQVQMKPKKTYDIETVPPNVGLIDRFLGTYQKQTHWPNAHYMRSSKK